MDVKAEIKRILIVDDEKTVAYFLGESLRIVNPSWEVIAVSNMRDALATLVHHQFDLMITDLRMPMINGVELISHVRENWPDTKVFLITAYSSDDVAEKARQMQLSGFMTKPFDMDLFLARVSEILES